MQIAATTTLSDAGRVGRLEFANNNSLLLVDANVFDSSRNDFESHLRFANFITSLATRVTFKLIVIANKY